MSRDFTKLIGSFGITHRQVLSDYLGSHAGIPIKSAVISELLATNDTPKVLDTFVRSFGLNSGDFAQISAAPVEQIVKTFPEPTFRRLAKFVEATDLKMVNLLAPVEDASNTVYREHGEIPTTSLSTLKSEPAAAPFDVKRFTLSFQLLKNQADWIRTVPAALLNSFFRAEAQSLFALLESNPNLSDGDAWFSGDNTATGTLGLAAALNLFRSQRARGTNNVLSEPLKFAIVPGSIELAFRKDLQQAGMNFVEVFARPDVTNVYLLTDQQTSPTIIRIGLDDRPSINLSRVPRSDGLAVTGTHSAKYIPLSRYGIVRLTAA